MIRYAFSCFLLSVALGIGSDVARADGPPLSTGALQALLDSEPERRGDLSTLRSQWRETLERDPNSLEAQAILTLWGPKLRNTTEAPLPSAFWKSIFDRTTSNGWSKRMVGWRLHDAWIREGEWDAAHALPTDRGTPRRWAGIGPFGRRSAAALHHEFSPELRFDPNETPDGTDDLPVEWRPITSVPGDSRVYLTEEWGKRGAVYYLRSRFEIAESTDALLQLVSSGSYRVWLDGAPLITVDRARDRSPIAERIGVRLEAGSHTLLIKAAASEVAALFRDANGHALDLVDLDPLSTGSNAASARASVETRGLLIERLRERANSDELRGLEALLFAYVAAGERDTIGVHTGLQRADEESTSRSALAIVATDLAAQIDYLPLEWKKRWLTELWDQALAANPGNVPVLLARAEEWFRDDRAEEAEALVAEAQDQQPNSLRAALLVEEIADRFEWRRERRLALDRLRAIAPRHPTTLSRWIRYEAARGREDRHLPLLREWIAVEPSPSLWTQLAAAHAALGEKDEAVAALDSLLRLGRGSTRSLARVVDGWRELGETERLLSTLDELRRRRPDSAALHREAGDERWKLGRNDDAARAYRASLACQPGQLRLLDRLRWFGSGTDGLPTLPDDYRRYWIDTEEALAAAPPRDRYPRAASTYLVDQMVTRIDPERGGFEYVHQLVRLDSDQAVEQFSNLRVPGEVLEVRVLTPDGEVLEPTSDGGGGGFTLPGLAPGAIVEYRSVSRFDVPRLQDLTLGPFYFRDPNFQAAFHQTEWVVEIPDSWEVEVDLRNEPNLVEESVVGGFRVRRWAHSEMAPVLPEFRMPPGREVLPNVALETPREWGPVHEAIIASGVRSSAVTPVTAEAAASVLSGVADDARSKALAIHRAVCDRVTSPGGPSQPSAVWIEKAGDRDALIAGLLRAADVPFQWVFCALRDDMEPFRDWSRPAMDAFGFTVIRVPLPDGDLYLNGAMRLAAAGRLPIQVQGARALVVYPNRTEWIRLPVSPIESEARRLETTVRLGDGKAVEIDGRAVFGQLSASNFKEQLANVNEYQRTATIEGFVRQTFPRSRVKSGDFPELLDPNAPFTITFQAESASPGVLRVSENRPVVTAVFTPSLLRDGFVRRADRQFPYFSEVESLVVEENRIELGANYRAHRLPENVDLAGPWGTFHLGYRLEENVVVVSRRLWLEPFSIPASQVTEFFRFCTEVDAREQEPIVLERITP